MNAPDTPLRRQVYALLIVVATGIAIGRIFSAELVLEPSYYRINADPPHKGRGWPKDRPAPMPTFSSNDRSRWCTVYALVEKGEFVIGRYDPKLVSPDNKIGADGIVARDGFKTIDIMMNPETKEFYSTKPPLLPLLIAGEYWLFKHLFGWDLIDNANLVVRAVLLTFNVVPWVMYLLLLAKLLERFGTTDWGRLYVMAAACFGTMMTPFLITVNNHTVGTCTALFALWFAAKVWLDERVSGWTYAWAGFFAAFTVTQEYPALALLAALGLALLRSEPRKTLLWFAPAAVLPLGALILTNYLAIGDWKPGYSKFGSEWYTFPGSHWGKDPDPIKPGIDFARTKETRLEYAFHVLLGHHGLFSLTPIVLLALWGMIASARRLASLDRERPEDGSLRSLTLPALLHLSFALLALVLTALVVGFYLGKSDNYGGWTNGPRWLMWLTPLWLLAMLPVADRIGQSRWGRLAAGALLVLSILSMHYQSWNPWRHPWIYNALDSQGWIPY